jgi:sugar phosphate isomerase/epimerase
MLKRSVVVAGMLAIGFVLGFGTLRSPRKRSRRRRGPDCTDSRGDQGAEDAEKHLQRAEQHFGGHRAKALELVKQAEGELKQAVEYAQGQSAGAQQAGEHDDPGHHSGAGNSAAAAQTMTAMLALHTWTLDTTPLADALRATRTAGWDGVELRRIDFARAAEKGQTAAHVLTLVKASGLRVACVGVELGWMFADGDERRKLMQAFDESCRWAVELGCQTVMSATDRGRGDLARAAANMREAAGIAASHRVKLAVEFNSQADQLNNLEVMRGVVAKAAHASCGLLLDTYHLQRSGASLAAIEDVALGEIAYFQYSDVPRSGLEPGKALDGCRPGGERAAMEIFAPLDRKGYRGFMSYEARTRRGAARRRRRARGADATRVHLPPAETSSLR